MIRLRETINVDINEAISIQNEIGETQNIYQYTKTIKMEIQPLKVKSNRDLQGITETSTHRGFSTDTIKSNQRLITADNIIYNIQTVQDYKSHKEAILELINE